MRTRDEQIKPWGYISPFATETLRDRARCDLTITRKQMHNITIPLYTEDQLHEAEHRAEQRVRAEIGRDSERLDWLAAQILRVRERAPYQPIIIDGNYDPSELRDAIDAAREAE